STILLVISSLAQPRIANFGF
ncbi:hypothetical protein pipiens_018605, partial [Culex pipiens pipiens]